MSTQLFQQRTDLLALYREIHDQPGEFVDAAARAELQAQAQRLLAEAFQVAFIGRFSVGKSMLINRLFLMHDVLTVALKPTTARLMYIKYGEQPALWLVRADAAGYPERVPLAAPGATVEDIAAAIKEHTTHLGDVKGEDAGNYQLDWPDGQFFRDGVQLVDSIGTEDIDDQFVNATYTAIRQSDAVVMVLTMTQPLTESEQKFIDEHLGRTGKKVFLVVNKADAREPDEQREVLDDLTQRFSRLYRKSQLSTEERIIAVSAKTGQGLEELRERLVQFVADERLAEILRTHQTSLLQQLNRWQYTCRQRLTEHQSKKNGNELQLRAAREQLRELSGSLARQHGEIEAMQDELYDEIQDGVSEITDKGKQKLHEFRLGRLNIDNIRIELADFFRGECARLFDKLQRKTRVLLQRRISLLAGVDPANLEQLVDPGSDASAQTVSTGGILAGGAALLAGGGAMIGAAQLATATPISLWGSWIAGQSAGTVFAGALAPWAIPAIAGGLALAYAAKKATDQQQAKDREAFFIAAQSKLRQDCENLERTLREQIDESIEQAWEQFQDQVKREGQELEQLITRTDLTALDGEIATLSDEDERLSAMRQRVEAFMGIRH